MLWLCVCVVDAVKREGTAAHLLLPDAAGASFRKGSHVEEADKRQEFSCISEDCVLSCRRVHSLSREAAAQVDVRYDFGANR